MICCSAFELERIAVEPDPEPPENVPRLRSVRIKASSRPTATPIRRTATFPSPRFHLCCIGIRARLLVNCEPPEGPDHFLKLSHQGDALACIRNFVNAAKVRYRARGTMVLSPRAADQCFHVFSMCEHADRVHYRGWMIQLPGPEWEFQRSRVGRFKNRGQQLDSRSSCAVHNRLARTCRRSSRTLNAAQASEQPVGRRPVASCSAGQLYQNRKPGRTLSDRQLCNGVGLCKFRNGFR